MPLSPLLRNLQCTIATMSVVALLGPVLPALSATNQEIPAARLKGIVLKRLSKKGDVPKAHLVVTGEAEIHEMGDLINGLRIVAIDVLAGRLTLEDAEGRRAFLAVEPTLAAPQPTPTVLAPEVITLDEPRPKMSEPFVHSVRAERKYSNSGMMFVIYCTITNPNPTPIYEVEVEFEILDSNNRYITSYGYHTDLMESYEVLPVTLQLLLEQGRSYRFKGLTYKKRCTLRGRACTK